MDPNANDPRAAHQGRPSTGFEVFESLVAEAILKGGTSPTLERWVKEAQAKLAEIRAEHLSPREAQAVDGVEQAFLEAAGLFERSLRGAQSGAPHRT